jgi:hypothetical protein
MRDNIVWKLWDTANIITGFTAVQALGYTFALMSTELKSKLNSLSTFITILLILIVGCLIYLIAILWCSKFAREIIMQNKGKTNDESEEKLIQIKLWNKTTLGRAAAIIFFSLIPIVYIVGCYLKQS